MRDLLPPVSHDAKPTPEGDGFGKMTRSDLVESRKCRERHPVSHDGKPTAEGTGRRGSPPVSDDPKPTAEGTTFAKSAGMHRPPPESLSSSDDPKTEPEGTARRRAQHAAAMRRLRQREKAGTLMVTVALTPAHTVKLHRLQYLRDSELEDRRAIAAAIIALLDSIKIEP
jgi:hypothetical protein